MKKMLGIASVVLASASGTNAFAVESQPDLAHMPDHSAPSTASVGGEKSPTQPVTSGPSSLVVAYDSSCYGVAPGGPNFWCTN